MPFSSSEFKTFELIKELISSLKGLDQMRKVESDDVDTSV
jgi:hypothetical protein